MSVFVCIHLLLLIFFVHLTKNGKTKRIQIDFFLSTHIVYITEGHLFFTFLIRKKLKALK